jgi:hypothetical protein
MGIKKPENLDIQSILLILFSVLIISTIMLVLFGIASQRSSNYSLTLILIFGVVFMISALAIASTVFNCLKLSSTKEALGLPSGSIRALIALCLIVIFAIMTIYMSGGLSNTPLKDSNGTILTYPNGTVIYQEPSAAQRDFASQTLTTVSTLVVALVSFYFGSKAIETTRGAVTRQLSTNPSGKVEIQKGKELSITVDPEPDDEAYSWKIDGDEKGKLIQEKPNQFIYQPSESVREESPVNLIFTMVKDSNISKKVEVTVKERKLELVIEPQEGVEYDKATGSVKLDSNKKLAVKVNTSPKGEEFIPKVDGDDPQALKMKTSSEFIYKSVKPTKETVTLIFSLVNKTEVSKKLEVTTLTEVSGSEPETPKQEPKSEKPK